uniref:Protein kinase domain-containing protein n=1 Tax=Ditylenchus dipsaci TaxID=166011 RepID=A0A915ESD4_9BILA
MALSSVVCRYPAHFSKTRTDLPYSLSRTYGLDWSLALTISSSPDWWNQFDGFAFIGPPLGIGHPDQQFLPETALRLCLQTLQAIHDIHLCHFVHRNIHPKNFLFG